MALVAGDMVNVMTCAGDVGDGGSCSGGSSSLSLSAFLAAVSASLGCGERERDRGMSVTADDDKSGPRDVAAAAAVVAATLGVAMPVDGRSVASGRKCGASWRR